MNASVSVLPEAKQDLLAGSAYFERCEHGLGHEFLIEAFAAFDRIAFMPASFGVLEKEIRAASV